MSCCENSDQSRDPSGEIIKDSTIQVTVDDLQPGLIVVSFSHKRTLYQGVLLQLDRNRGIPCGISFPKSFIQDGHSEPTAKEIVAVELPPLNKRQTYFQRDLLNDPTSAIVDPSTKFPTLRRNIKPPARYKNSRMNLRVRHRPVLCAKCQTLCEDKGPPPSKNENTDDDAAKLLANNTTVSSSSSSSSSSRRNHTKLSRCTEDNNLSTTGRRGALVDTSSTTNLYSSDYSYSSYGQRGVVTNYWRRPNSTGDFESSSSATTTTRRELDGFPNNNNNNYQQSATRSTIVPVAGSSKSVSNNEIRKLYIKPMPPLQMAPIKRDHPPPPPSTHHSSILPNSSFSSESLPLWSYVTSSSSSSSNGPPSSSRHANIKKSNNLKLCISKLAISKCDSSLAAATTTTTTTTVPKETDRVTRSTATTTSITQEESDDAESSVDHMDSNHFEGGGGKGWNTRIRKRSTVPARFRDESYFTKNSIFSFKRRRVDETSPADDGSREDDYPPLYTSRIIVPSGGGAAAEHDLERMTKEEEGGVEKEADKNQDVSFSDNSGCSSLSSSSVASMNVSTNGDHHHPHAVEAGGTTTNKGLEPPKTPVIKITFNGSTGNCIVLQIPPKITQEESPSNCVDNVSSRAARKAMKKAKKKARRKISLSREPSPSATINNNAFSSETLQENLPDSPLLPLQSYTK